MGIGGSDRLGEGGRGFPGEKTKAQKASAQRLWGHAQAGGQDGRSLLGTSLGLLQGAAQISRDRMLEVRRHAEVLEVLALSKQVEPRRPVHRLEGFPTEAVANSVDLHSDAE